MTVYTIIKGEPLFGNEKLIRGKSYLTYDAKLIMLIPVIFFNSKITSKTGFFHDIIYVGDKMKKDDNKIKWFLTVCIMSFILSIMMSLVSETVIPKINIIFGIIIILVFIFISIIFDMIGVAITAAQETPFHSMASKKVKGSKHSVILLKNADKLASICNDVVGDVCGVVSGSAGVLVAVSISSMFNLNQSVIVLITTALIASLTITGKALGKSTAIKNSEKITFRVGKFINFFKK